MQTGHLSGVPETWMDTKYKEGRGWVSQVARDNYVSNCIFFYIFLTL